MTRTRNRSLGQGGVFQKLQHDDVRRKTVEQPDVRTLLRHSALPDGIGRREQEAGDDP